MENKLTVAYLYTEGLDNPDWHQDFLSDFVGSPWVPVRFQGIVGNLSEARYLAYTQIKTPYVAMLDPDDRVKWTVIRDCLEFLETNPNIGACGACENTITERNVVRPGHAPQPFSMNRFVHSPLELHTCTVLRTSQVIEVLEQLRPIGFYNIDWALRLCIAERYGAHKLPTIGYSFRRKENSHHAGALYTDTQIHRFQTVKKLRELGLLSFGYSSEGEV